MSGVAGIIRFDGGPAETALVETMTAAMAHRGPDGIAHWSGGSVALGHLMLHTTPESLDERQPLVSADGQRVLVVHGRVDNRDELAEALSHRGVRPLDNSDAALFLASYEAWGDDFPDRIDGDFALVIWDACRRAAICARDRVGAKPFAWHWDGTRFSFASEVRPILDLPWVEQRLDEATIAQFLGNDFRTPSGTFFQDVHRLTPGQRMVVTENGPSRAFYWSLDVGRTLRYRREAEYAEHYRHLLNDTVHRLSRTHRPLACEVSGGLDSSALFAVSDRLARLGLLQSPDLLGYTLHFDEDTRANELHYARAVAAHLGREVHEIEPTLRTLDWYTEQAARTLDIPSNPNSEMSAGMYAAAAAAGSRVILNGIGGDELLSGATETYAEAIATGDISGLVAAARADARDFGANVAARRILRQGLYPLVPAVVRTLVSSALRPQPDHRLDWLLPGLESAVGALPRRPPTPLSGLRFENQKRVFRLIWDPYLPHIFDVLDRIATGVGVEHRRPFTSVACLRFFASMPEHLLRRGATRKYLHRLGMAGDLPAVVLERTDKAEFSTTYVPLCPEIRERWRGGKLPFAEGWVRKEPTDRVLKEIADAPLADPHVAWALFACDAVAQGGASHASGAKVM